MKLGTPGFIGDRLREAREIRGLQSASLAEMIGVSPQAVSQYETGRSSPSPEMLRALAHRLNVQEHFFTLAPRDTSERRIFFRSLASATKGARARAGRRLLWLEDIVSFVSSDVHLPETSLPDFSPPTDHHLISQSDIEGVAEDVRSAWGFPYTPVPNLVHILESKGVIVARDQLLSEALDSLSEHDDVTNKPYVLIGTDKGTAVRWRYDAAHELGHLLLHSKVDSRVSKSAQEMKIIEDQANRFASAFLLPMASFSEDLFASNLDAMRMMKPKWKTSIAAMMVRARQTQMISDDAYRRLWANYNRRGWRRNEPLDDELAEEVPSVLRLAFQALQERLGDAVEQASSVTGIAEADIRSLSGLSDGQSPLQTVLLKASGANVLPFKKPSQGA